MWLQVEYGAIAHSGRKPRWVEKRLGLACARSKPATVLANAKKKFYSIPRAEVQGDLAEAKKNATGPFGDWWRYQFGLDGLKERHQEKPPSALTERHLRYPIEQEDIGFARDVLDRLVLLFRKLEIRVGQALYSGLEITTERFARQGG